MSGAFLRPKRGCRRALSLRALLLTGHTPHSFSDDVVPLFDEPGGIAFGDALRANKKLTALYLRHVRLWDVFPAGVAVINGIVGHGTLKKLELYFNNVAAQNRQIVGDALGRLIAVPSAFINLTLSHCELWDEGLRPLFQAFAHSLPGNANLQTLCVLEHDEICIHDFAVEVREAVQNNTSLRGLGFDSEFYELDAAVLFTSQRRVRNTRA